MTDIRTPEAVPLSHDEMGIFIEVLPMAIGIARGAADYAESYRGVHVGSVAVGLSPDGDEVLFSDGWNTKGSPSDVKFCAEMRSLLGAKDLGLGRVLGLVVAGPTDPDVIGSITASSDTLKPCDACQTFMTHDERVSEQTPILSVGRNIDIAEFTSLGELKADTEGLVATQKPGKFLFTSGNWGPVMRAYNYLIGESDVARTTPLTAARVALLNSVPLSSEA